MKKNLYPKEFLKMQKLAGIITEGQYKTLIQENYSHGNEVSYEGRKYIVVASSENNDLLMTDKLKQKLADSETDEKNFVVLQKPGPNIVDSLATDELLYYLNDPKTLERDLKDRSWIIVDKSDLSPATADKSDLSPVNELIDNDVPIELYLLRYLEIQTGIEDEDKEAEKIYADNFDGDEEKGIKYKTYNDLTPDDIEILKRFLKKKVGEKEKAALNLMSDIEKAAEEGNEAAK